MLKIYRTLFDRLAFLNIGWCSWKNNHELGGALAGDSDLDFLIEPNNWRVVEEILLKLNFREFIQPVAKYPFIHHFYGLDSSGRYAHLHLYCKCVTGESQTKLYHIPIERELIRGREQFDNTNCYVLNKNDQLAVFLVRYFIKCGSFISLLRLFFDRQDYKTELENLHVRSHLNYLSASLNILGIPLDQYFIILTTGGLKRKIFATLKLKFALMPFRRKSGISMLIYRWQQGIHRILNKAILKRGKRLPSGGRFICIVGSDGTGKSTLVSNLSDFFSEICEIRKIHFGRPPSTVFTLPFNILLNIFKRYKSPKINDNFKKSKNKNTSLLMAIRYLILACERRSLGTQVQRWLSSGLIVISDRYPSIDCGVMDSPRIICDKNSSFFLKILNRMETRIYQTLPIPDLLLRMNVACDVAVERNKLRSKIAKESESEIRSRHEEFESLSYNAYNIVEIDANMNLERVLMRAKQNIWNVL